MNGTKVAVLYQAEPPPAIGGLVKPMKPGGYSDSGADIAFNLRQSGVSVATPHGAPDPPVALDWVYPDTAPGIARALEDGANVLWANTVLFDGHPLQGLRDGERIVGQDPATVGRFDDKFATNEILREHGLSVVRSRLVTRASPLGEERLPIVLKPVRGRGSQGVRLIRTPAELGEAIESAAREFGEPLILEEFLPGQEITLTVLPPGRYRDGQRDTHWSLPAVTRRNHIDGIAPYNGTVAVVRNSEVLPATATMERAARQCEAAARIVGARAAIRIDCRMADDGEFRLFDLNMKPNLTGPGRPGREDQDSLTSLAARALGWDYGQLLLNLLDQAWSPER